MFKPFGPRVIIPTSFEEALSYEEQITFLWKYIQDLEAGTIAAQEIAALNKRIDDLRAEILEIIYGTEA